MNNPTYAAYLSFPQMYNREGERHAQGDAQTFDAHRDSPRQRIVDEQARRAVDAVRAAGRAPQTVEILANPVRGYHPLFKQPLDVTRVGQGTGGVAEGRWGVARC